MPNATATATAAPGVRQSNNFNLIRLVLALLVIVAHSAELVDGNRSREWLTRIFHTLSFGEVAVDGFFVLSGYLILQSWLVQPAPGIFLRKRLLRIVPAYLVAALLCAFVVGPLGAAPAPYFAGIWWGGLLKSLLWLDTPATPPTFIGSHYPSVNGAMWTIHYEFLCYLMVLALGWSGLLRRRHAVAVVAAVFIAAWMAARAGGLAWAGAHIEEEGLLIARFGSFFFMGGLYLRYRLSARAAQSRPRLALAGLLACLLFSASAELGLLVPGAWLLFFAAFYDTRALDRLRHLPDLSYGVYLYGWPLGKLLLCYLPALSPLPLMLLTAVLACGCGLLSWTWIERPALALKQRGAVPGALLPRRMG
jgi:peptidoglycan/LPS O-acetylase OafA/YrhL